MHPKSWLRRTLKIAGYSLAAVVVAILLTVITMEARCRGTATPAATAFRSVLEPAERRDEANSYLTYPEWSVVYAYQDLAGVMRRGSESDFKYFQSISGFWSSLCSVKRLASGRGPIAFDYTAALYIIGVSFTAEMGVKGAYEKTIGAVTAWIRGATRTPEDNFALTTADDYAAFLRQVPWYEYPFGAKLVRFWADTPLWGGNIIRKIERRIALTLEYGSKMVYARGIAALAGLSPAPLQIRSVVAGLDQTDTTAEPRITVIRAAEPNARVIETPRYRAFTEIMRGLAARNRNFTEIAGNQNILVTVLVPPGTNVAPDQATELLSVPIQTRPGWHRFGLDVKVPGLLAFLRGISNTPVELEHVYDY